MICSFATHIAKKDLSQREFTFLAGALSVPQLPLPEVALASGFADQHHLARVFRRITGVTPSSYRRSLE
jgi:AraC family transcriptional regulator